MAAPNSAGSGPYVLDTYRPDDELRFRVNENYWGDAPPIGEIVIDHVADAVSQAQMLQSGGADIAMQVDPDTASTINSPDITIETVPSYNFIYVMFSPGAEGGDMLDLEVRQALAALPEGWGCSHINFLWDSTRGGALVQARPRAALCRCSAGATALSLCVRRGRGGVHVGRRLGGRVRLGDGNRRRGRVRGGDVRGGDGSRAH